jgi:uncharacterized protein
MANSSTDRIKGMLSSVSSASRDENLCGVGFDIVTVKPDGSVYSCYVFSEQEEHKYGNILEDDFWRNFSKGASSSVLSVASRFKHVACEACDIQSACTHCLSGMTEEDGMNSILPDVNCHFNIGQIEGVIDAISDRKRDGSLDELASELAKA